MIENQQPANAKGPDICPGERDVDDALVARTIAVANARWARQAPNALLAVAQHVMAALFGGDLVRFRERHHRHLTFRAVANSPRLAISACSLRDALRVLAWGRERRGTMSSGGSGMAQPPLYPPVKARLSQRGRRATPRSWTSS